MWKVAFEGIHSPAMECAPISSGRRRSPGLMLCMVGVWGALAVAASFISWTHAAKPGEAAVAPRGWPIDSGVELESERLTILVFAHPACACTPATMDELAPQRSRIRDEGAG